MTWKRYNTFPLLYLVNQIHKIDCLIVLKMLLLLSRNSKSSQKLFHDVKKISKTLSFKFFLQFKEIKSVSFRGDGYVELTSQPLRSESSFGFSFRTLAEQGLLILSTFQGQPNGDLVSQKGGMSPKFLQD